MATKHLTKYFLIIPGGINCCSSGIGIVHNFRADWALTVAMNEPLSQVLNEQKQKHDSSNQLERDDSKQQRASLPFGVIKINRDCVFVSLPNNLGMGIMGSTGNLANSLIASWLQTEISQEESEEFQIFSR